MSGELDNVDLMNPPEVDQEEEQEQEENKGEEQTLGDVLRQYPGAPDDREIEIWKQQHGEVLCSGLSETELYIFRPITRQEYINLQTYIAKMEGKVNNFEVEVKIVENCVLWSSPAAQESLEKKAGTYSTLHEQILQASNFMNPAYVSNFVIKL